MPTFRSPNEMLQKAKDAMLEGREPQNKTEWMNLMLFVCVNIHESVRLEATKFFVKLMDVPLSEEEVQAVYLIAEKNLREGTVRSVD
jgi:hypothetical protein